MPGIDPMASGQGHPTQLFVNPEARTNNTVAKSPTTGFTLRISSIPSSITEERFLEFLNDLSCDACRNDNQPNVLGYSYALPVASIDHQKSRTATVTFRSIPLMFKTLTPMPIDLFGKSSTIVDSHFYGLTPLNNPSQEPIADLIAVTGLAGHAFGSWKSRGGYKMWLRDFLPTHIPNVRILTYGYDSTLFKNSSTASIIEFSRNFLEALKVARSGDEEKSRPVVFIGHSLGGLVIKQALVTASRGDDEDKSIFSSCHALLLFSVPHKGLKVEHLRSMVKGQPNSRLIEDLNDEPSNFLRLLHDSWKSIRQEDTRVVSVYETKPTPTVQETFTGWKRTGPEVLMVSRDSAIQATPEQNESDIFSIDANHSDIVKFNNDACQDYLTVRSKVVDLVRGLHEMYALLPEAKRHDILGWLSKIEYIKHHENAKEGLLENTGQWLLQREEFREWRSSKISSILWLHGIPGAGKTKLTCMVTDTVKSAIPEDKCQKNEPVLYFYCNRNEPLRQDPEAVLQAVVKQLSLARPDLRGLPKAVVKEYDKRKKDGFASGSLGFQESHQLVLLLLRLHRQTTLIIDALDECDPRKRLRLLEVLKGIIQPIGSKSLVKVFISSRDDTDITLKLEDVPNLYINASDNNRDIARFVEREVAQCIENGLLLCGHVTNELKQQIISAIVAKAKGMFQWADLQIKHLCQMSDEDDMKENLGKSPETLEEAYSRIYKAILSEKPHALELTKKALMWVMCSRRVLTREEWTEATYWPKDVPNGSVPTLFKLCRNLVTWDSQSNAVRFAHLSVREYLESQFTSMDANSMAARCCLELLDPLYPQNFEDQNLSPPRNALVKYSTIYWPDHVEYSYDGARHMPRGMLDFLQGFLGTPTNPSKAYCKWYQRAMRQSIWRTQSRNFWPRSDFAYVKSAPLNPLFAMSYFTFGKELMDLWQPESASISNKVVGDASLLELIASKQDGEWVVDFSFGNNLRSFRTSLLREANDRVHGRVVFTTASDQVNVACTEVAHAGVSLEKIKEIILHSMLRDPQGWKGKELVRCRDVNTIKLLLLGDVNARVTKAAAAATVRMCDTYTILMLLSDNPDIETTEAVLIAVVGDKWSSEEIVEVLLAKNPGIEVITEAVLIAGAGNERSRKIMGMLLAKDLNIKVITEAVLIAAVGNERRSDEIVQILLAKNPKLDVTEAAAIELEKRVSGIEFLGTVLTNIPGILNSEAIVIAVARNHWCGDKMMDTLLRTGHKTKITEEVIIAAAGNQTRGKEILSILLGKNPKIEITEAVVTAAAQRWGRQDIIKFLVKEANLTEEATAAVAKISSKTVMEELLAKNIEITETVLIAATKNKWSGKQTMMLLLDKNPDMEITEAVMTAAAENDQEGGEIVKMLLARKQDIGITQTVLAAAAGNEWSGKEVTEVLRNIKVTDTAVSAAKHGRSGERILEAPPTKKLKAEPTVVVNGHLSPNSFKKPNLEQ